MPEVALAAPLALGLGAPLPFSQDPAVVGSPTRWFYSEAPQSIVAEVRPMTLLADQELQRILDWLEIEDVPRGRIVWGGFRDH